MFLSENIPALFKKGTLKLTETEDGYRRVAEATLVIEPFQAKLAHQLGEDIAGHLFTDDNAIRDELESIDLRVRCGLQSVTARLDEALDPVAVLKPVSIKDVSVTRIENKKTQQSWLSCSFVLVFSLEERAARNFVLDEFGKTLLWSFESMQADLLADARLHESAARLGEGGVTTLTYANPDGSSGSVEFNDETAKRSRATAKELRAAAADTLRKKTH